jgi:ADP-heptose:LPS heptosyltransferase
MGDVLLAGPAIRAVATRARVTLLCGPAGAAAAARLPGVTHRIVQPLPWIAAEPERVDLQQVSTLVESLRESRFDEAIVLTSFHQSALPTALLLRMAGVPRIGAISEDYPGSLLDVRHHVDDDIHEVKRNLSLANAMGYHLACNDDDRLRISASPRVESPMPYVAVHPGASVPARTLAPAAWSDVVESLAQAGRRVIVTAGDAEAALARAVVRTAAATTASLRVTSDFDDLVAAVQGAGALVTGNTGPAHLAAALGTPVVSCFAPTVPARRWHPWRIPFALLGDQGVVCAGCRARSCPREEQECLAAVRSADVVDAVDALVDRVAAEPIAVEEDRSRVLSGRAIAS